MRDSRTRRRELDALVAKLSAHVGMELSADFSPYGGWVLVTSDNSKPFGARRRTRGGFIDVIEFAIDAYKVKERGHA